MDRTAASCSAVGSDWTRWPPASIAAVAAGWLVLTAAGTALVLAQAFAVALFAELQIFGLRRAQPVTS